MIATESIGELVESIEVGVVLASHHGEQLTRFLLRQAHHESLVSTEVEQAMPFFLFRPL